MFPSNWHALRSDLNALYPEKAEIITLLSEDPRLRWVGTFAVPPDVAEQAATLKHPINEKHAILAHEPRWNDNPLILDYKDIWYDTIYVLRARGEKPAVLSSCALICNSTENEIILHRRSPRSATYGENQPLHIFGGNFAADRAEGPDRHLEYTLKRELMEETGSLSVGSLSGWPARRVMGRETATGFIQLVYLGLDFPVDAIKRIETNWEGDVVHVPFSKLFDRLINPSETWVESGQIMILLWLALGAPMIRVDGSPLAHRFDSGQARQIYRRVMSRLRQASS